MSQEHEQNNKSELQHTQYNESYVETNNDNEENDDIVYIKSFDELSLKKDLLKGIYNYGFEKPSAIQQCGIQPVIEGHDVIGQAQSGTGKTATFVIAMLQVIDETLDKLQGLILAPTRELAAQIQRVTDGIGTFLNISCITCIGGTNTSYDIEALRKGVHIVVATPGRISELMRLKRFPYQDSSVVVIDEADEMLSRGFIDQVTDILSYINQNKSGNIVLAMFSATMPKEILALAETVLENPKRILVRSSQLTLEGIKQFYVNTENDEHKYSVLTELYETIEIQACIIYANSRKRVEDLAMKMTEDNHTVSFIHGDMPQKEREGIMEQFRLGSTRVLITTDLLARGIDVQTVSLVINYDLPSNYENYLHRIGRSGRFGKKGVAINFASRNDMNIIRGLEQFYQTQIQLLINPEN